MSETLSGAENLRIGAFEQIAPEQIEDALCVLDAAARRLVARGIEQYRDGPLSFVEDGWRAEKLREEAAAGNVWVARLGTIPIGTITITDWADPDFAHGWPGGTGGTGDAVYVIRLATADAARKMDMRLGSHLLTFASFVAGWRKKSRVRLDCMRGNTGLHNYYLSQGFTKVGEVVVPGRKSGTLFERPVTLDEGQPAQVRNPGQRI